MLVVRTVDPNCYLKENLYLRWRHGVLGSLLTMGSSYKLNYEKQSPICSKKVVIPHGIFCNSQELSSMVLEKSPCLDPHGRIVLVVALLCSRVCQKCGIQVFWDERCYRNVIECRIFKQVCPLLPVVKAIRSVKQTTGIFWYFSLL